MRLHELKLVHKRKRIKRVGRGGKRGTFSGRGQKGQKARAGRRIRPAERDLFQRLPKLRGVKNKAIKNKPSVFNVGDLEKRFGSGVLNKEVLIKKGLLKKQSESVKILSDGDIKKVFNVSGLLVSKKAKEKIEKAGGTVR